MIRKATQEDVIPVAELYNEAIDYEDAHIKYTSWQKGIYPTADTARLGVKNGSLYVYEENGAILASVILDTHQPPEYRNVSWGVDAGVGGALVIHTLCVDPRRSGGGVGSAIVDFAKTLAKEKGCRAIRLNTTTRNLHATHLYKKNGFTTAATKKILLNGQIHCNEHYFMEFIL